MGIHWDPKAMFHADVVRRSGLEGKTMDGGWLFPDGRYEKIQGHDGSGLQSGGLVPNFARPKKGTGLYRPSVDAALKAARRGEADSFKRFAEISAEEGGPKRSTLQKWVFNPGWLKMTGSGSALGGVSLSQWGQSSAQNERDLNEIVDWGIEYKSRGQDKDIRNKKIALGVASKPNSRIT